MKIEYPSIYDETNRKSARSQTVFLGTVKAEYLILIITAVNAAISYKYQYIANLYLFSLLIVLLGVRYFFNFEKKWYKYRAVTESIKTTTWKFAMKAEPFNSGEGVNDAKQFIDYIIEILKGSRYAIKTKTDNSIRQDSFNICLREIRSLDYESRRDFYVNNRIMEQHEWYSNKAVYNKRIGRAWGIAILALYVASFGLSAYNARFATPTDSMPTELITTILASLIGWVQTKKFNELSASYSLTAHEIGLIKEQAYYVVSENEFISFVRDAETAFSREHTQWLARRIA